VKYECVGRETHEESLFVQERNSLSRGLEHFAMELEALATVSSIEHFACYLYGIEFSPITDHKVVERYYILI